MCPADTEKANDCFSRHGKAAVCFGRLLPTIRALISVPAGLARMPMVGFIAYSTVGSLQWTALLALGGYVLEAQYEKVTDYLDPISVAVIALIVITYIYRLVRLKRR
ncbi:DedA family protein [Halopseudomonas xinjiangensis]|uniref:DedA family protein n=1 Tax=Halopseudomonas xinjiangensis TaxID=487184 RepID=UPI001E4A7497|nr:DedA family protein [Halopseudomonas xinjiangensis]